MTDEEPPDLPDSSSPTTPEAQLSAATDPELIVLVRAGGSAAYEELYLRHRAVAVRYARRIASAQRAEDLCAEAFAKILDLLQRGKGPDVAFRAYLLTTIRTSHLNSIRSSIREDLVPDHDRLSRMRPVPDDPDGRFDRDAICRAFVALPERWQAALWLTAVEGLSNEEASEHLGINPNAVSSLALRARNGLRQAFLAEHLLRATDPRCRQIVNLLPSYLNGTLTPRRRAQVETHLASCSGCTAAAMELRDVDTRLGTLLAPLAFAGFSVAGAAIAPAHGIVLVGATILAKATGALGQAKAWISNIPPATAAKVAVIAVAVAVGIAVATCALDGGPASEAGPSGLVTKTVSAPTQHVRSPRGPSGRPPEQFPRSTAVPGPESARPVRHKFRRPASRPKHPAPSALPAAPARAHVLGVGPLATTAFLRNQVRWNRVTVPVTGAVEGTVLTTTTSRTLEAALGDSASSGWSCRRPTVSWLHGDLPASTITDCVYDGHGDGSPVHLEYLVGGGSRLTSEVTPPSGFVDTSRLDNKAAIDLVASAAVLPGIAVQLLP